MGKGAKTRWVKELRRNPGQAERGNGANMDCALARERLRKLELLFMVLHFILMEIYLQKIYQQNIMI